MSEKTKAYFITFEGPEGSGKSTQIKFLQNFLLERGDKVLVTREPGGTVVGDQIREIMLAKNCDDLHAETELFLMLAQRCEHLNKVILPAVASGITVLCDRYYDSSMAYQGYARGIGLENVKMAHEKFLKNFLPNLTILFQIDPATGLDRARHGGTKQHDRIESENLRFHKKVFDAYNILAQQEPNRFIKIDACGSAGSISETMINELKNRLAWG